MGDGPSQEEGAVAAEPVIGVIKDAGVRCEKSGDIVGQHASREGFKFFQISWGGGAQGPKHPKKRVTMQKAHNSEGPTRLLISERREQGLGLDTLAKF